MVDYSVEVCKGLEREFAACKVARPPNRRQYDPGDILVYDISPVITAHTSRTARATLQVQKLAGGGFAGQVYQVKLLSLEGEAGSLEPGKTYALKILLPISTRAEFFRTLLYWIGFQAPFQLRVNPAAARSGALWQEFIRRAAALYFKDEATVNRIHATLVDPYLGTCAEISDWVDGRTWRLEVDEHIELLSRWERGEDVPENLLGSPEYRYKKTFMQRFVQMLHDMGAHELARQYEWSTWKSQPNILKRLESNGRPNAGLTAVDFRAGLTLLPFLPMSPADIGLIFKGIKRGSLVQFDHGDIGQLERFIEAHKDGFTDMLPMLDELKQCENAYRYSIPDITHNLPRLLSDRALWSNISRNMVNGWKLRNLIDGAAEQRLIQNKLLVFLFTLLGFIPMIGQALQKYFGNTGYRAHYKKLFTDFDYLRRAMSARRAESLLDWYREGRVAEKTVQRILKSLPLYFFHVLLSILPVTLHRILSDRDFLRSKLYSLFIRPFKIYFNTTERKRWLREMVDESRESGIISAQDEKEILSQVDDPYIHTYLKSLAVHVCLSPTTHLVSGGLAAYYLITHPEMPRLEAYAVATGIIALFQVIPISPGSLARGLYVLYLALKERNFKDYSIALGMAFFKYIGYLAFPIQMAYRYPTMARFMAGYWATNLVHMVPVFGESGALLEHKVFRYFYNLPLTLRRKMSEREALRKMRAPRFWHAAFIVAVFALLGAFIESTLILMTGAMPTIGQIAPALIVSGFLGGFLVSLGSGGASARRRVGLAVASGLTLGVLITILSLSLNTNAFNAPFVIVTRTVWTSFITGTLSAIGAVAAEFRI